MKVLHIGSGNLYGGVEKVLLTLAQEKHLCPRMEPHFAVCFRGRLSEELQSAGARVFFLNEMSGRKPWSIARNRIALSRLQKTLNVDAVVYHSLWSYDLLGVGAQTGKARKVLWSHDAIRRIESLQLVAKLQEPDLIISNSQYTTRSIAKLFPKARPETIYYPVRQNLQGSRNTNRSKIRQSLKTREDDVVVIQVSRFEPYKGHRLHLEALSMLRDLSNWVLWIVGGVQKPAEKVYMTELMALAEQMQIADRIRFVGQRSDVPDLLASSDIHCQPNLDGEPFGLTFIEGLLAKLPVVTTEIGASPEIIDPSCGLLSPPNDAAGLAENLRTLILDPDLRSRLGANGPARAKFLCSPTERFNEICSALAAAC
jgi:glycosyltransferase involved in cell wall biosynthesis